MPRKPAVGIISARLAPPPGRLRAEVADTERVPHTAATIVETAPRRVIAPARHSVPAAAATHIARVRRTAAATGGTAPYPPIARARRTVEAAAPTQSLLIAAAAPTLVEVVAFTAAAVAPTVAVAVPTVVAAIAKPPVAEFDQPGELRPANLPRIHGLITTYLWR